MKKYKLGDLKCVMWSVKLSFCAKVTELAEVNRAEESRSLLWK